ncbi:MAG: sialidase family protein, partial [Chthoniobacteraceae bacterium]
LPAVLLAFAFCVRALSASADVEVRRVPDHGIKPGIVAAAGGALHMVWFSGEPAAGDAFHAVSKDGGATWTKALRVNSQPGSVLGASRARGPRLALGSGGRAHVLWLGSAKAEPTGNPDTAAKAAGHHYPAAPLLYARLDDAGSSFEPQRKIFLHATGLDGDASIAADASGHVFAVAHAKEPGDMGEAQRSVYVARSEDGGKTFAGEKSVLPEKSGVCACCALTVNLDASGRPTILYRQALKTFERGMNMLTSADGGKSFQLSKLDEWNLAACPMSVPALLPTRAGLLGAWETNGQIFFGTPGAIAKPLPGKGGTRKGPSLAVNTRGETLVAWTENTSFAGGGDVVWQVFTADGQPTEITGRRKDLPSHGWVAAASKADGGFVVMY